MEIEVTLPPFFGPVDTVVPSSEYFALSLFTCGQLAWYGTPMLTFQVTNWKFNQPYVNLLVQMARPGVGKTSAGLLTLASRVFSGSRGPEKVSAPVSRIESVSRGLAAALKAAARMSKDGSLQCILVVFVIEIWRLQKMCR